MCNVHVEEAKPVEKTEAEEDTVETLVDKRMKESIKSQNKMVNQCSYLYIIDGVYVVPLQNSEDRPEGPFWGL